MLFWQIITIFAPVFFAKWLYMKGNRSLYIGLFFLLLFLAFKTGATMFPHTHQVDGKTIVHSHPFANKIHTHSLEQIVTLALVTTYSTTEPISFIYESLFFPTPVTIDYESDTQFVSFFYCLMVALRAPPFVTGFLS